MNRRALITGGAGFIGSHLVDLLLQEGWEVRVIDNLSQKIHRNSVPDYLSADAEFIRGDVRDREAMRDAMQGITHIVHLAAYQDYLPDFSTFFSINAVSTALIYELALELQLPLERIVIASSQFVHGEGLYQDSSGNIRGPQFRNRAQLERGVWDHIDENGDAMRWLPTPESYYSPPNAYAMSKYSQEMQGLTFGRRYSIPTVALRYSIVQGARQSFHNAYSGACRIFSLSYLMGRSPTIFEDGMQERDFINVHDAVAATYLALLDERLEYDVLNVGGGRSCSVIDFDRIVAAEFGRDEMLPYIPGDYRFGDTRHAVSDITRLKSLGWEPKRTIEDSIREYADYVRGRTDLGDALAIAERQLRESNVIRHARMRSES